MANQSVNNVKGLMKNKATRFGIIATFGVIGVALIYSNMTTSNQASRPKDMQATVGAPSVPVLSATPGTSDNPLHNDKIRELNKTNATEAVNTGGSAVPRLSNSTGAAERDPFDLTQKKDAVDKPADAVVPLPSTSKVSLPQVAASPPAPPVLVVKSAQAKSDEMEMRAFMEGMLKSWTPGGQRLEVEYVGTKNVSEKSQGTELTQNVNGGKPMPTGLSTSSLSAATSTSEESGSGLQKKVSIKAGSILHAVIITAVNSDEPGPVLAQIIAGPYAGGRLMGKFDMPQNGQKMILTFSTLSMQNAEKSYDLTAYAVDPETARTALGSDVDNHYLSRYGMFTAATFMKAYSQALSQQGTTQTISVGGGGVASSTTRPTMNNKDLAISALGGVGGEIAGNLKGDLKRPPTVTLNSGTAIGLLIMKDSSF